MAGAVQIRDLVPADQAFLGRMLYAALLWRPEGPRPELERVLTHPELAIFHRDWGRDGDMGLVAELAGEPVGAVWCRFFTDEVHGHGYVDAETPELAIAVVDGHRGRGIGSALLHAAHAKARAAGVRRISLSVEADNPAKRLYEALGYVELERGDARGRMVLELGAAAA